MLSRTLRPTGRKFSRQSDASHLELRQTGILNRLASVLTMIHVIFRVGISLLSESVSYKLPDVWSSHISRNWSLSIAELQETASWKTTKVHCMTRMIQLSAVLNCVPT